MSDKEHLERLEQIRVHTQEEIERLKRELQEEIEVATATDDDRVDMAADVYERSKIISLIQSLETKLRSVDHAIEHVKGGGYGICELCGTEIPPERLEIVPETTLCVQCAAKVEQGIRRQQLQDAFSSARDRRSSSRSGQADNDDDD
jgi:RNA polymerase-binding transcription factor DksA